MGSDNDDMITLDNPALSPDGTQIILINHLDIRLWTPTAAKSFRLWIEKFLDRDAQIFYNRVKTKTDIIEVTMTFYDGPADNHTALRCAQALFQILIKIENERYFYDGERS